MKKLHVALLLAFCVTLSGCGLKQKAIDFKDKVADSFSKDEAAAAATSSGLTGMLLVLDPDKCPLVDGCGPQFSLLGRNLQSQVAIAGDIDPSHHNLIVTVSGKAESLPAELLGNSGYERINSIFNVESYRLRSNIPYHGFLVEQATTYTTSQLGCDLLWDKSYSWTIENYVPELTVLMTNTFAAQPYPYLELIFNGQTGKLIRDRLEPTGIKPCGI